MIPLATRRTVQQRFPSGSLIPLGSTSKAKHAANSAANSPLLIRSHDIEHHKKFYVHLAMGLFDGLIGSDGTNACAALSRRGRHEEPARRRSEGISMMCEPGPRGSLVREVVGFGTWVRGSVGCRTSWRLHGSDGDARDAQHRDDARYEFGTVVGWASLLCVAC